MNRIEGLMCDESSSSSRFSPTDIRFENIIFEENISQNEDFEMLDVDIKEEHNPDEIASVNNIYAMKEVRIVLTRLNHTEKILPFIEDDDDYNNSDSEENNTSGQMFSCMFCSRMFTNKLMLSKHLQEHIDKTKYQCEFCDRKLKNKTTYLKHKKLHHAATVPFECHKCKEKFHSQLVLMSHLQEDCLTETFDCEICKAKIKTLENYLIHKKEHEDQSDDENDVMDEQPIDQIFAIQNSNYNDALLIPKVEEITEEPKNPNECSICKKTFLHLKNLEKHIKRLHSSKERYNCNLCQKEFTSQSQLYTHRKKHGKKTFDCDKCQSSFVSEKSLNFHLKTHLKSLNTEANAEDEQKSDDEHEDSDVSDESYTSRSNNLEFSFTNSNENLNYRNNDEGDDKDVTEEENLSGKSITFHLDEMSLPAQLNDQDKDKDEDNNLFDKIYNLRGQSSKSISKTDFMDIDIDENIEVNDKDEDDDGNLSDKSYTPSLAADDGDYSDSIEDSDIKIRGNQFISKAILNNTLDTNTSTNIKCNLCNKKITSNRFRSHKLYCELIHKPQYHCEHCNFDCTQYSSFISHMLSHREKDLTDDIYRCNWCIEIYMKGSNFVDHMKNQHDNKCHECGKSFALKQNLNDHINLHSSSGNALRFYECKDCESKFSYSINFQIHQNTHNDTAEEHQCFICNMIFVEKGYLYMHMKTHNENDIYECYFCSKHYKAKKEFNKHLEVHLSPEIISAYIRSVGKSETYVCRQCQIPCRKKSLLIFHMQDHRIYHCYTCYERFDDRQLFDDHQKTHVYECNICDKKFLVVRKYDNHMLIHTDKNFYKCRFCTKQFQTGFGLYQHEKIHSINNNKIKESCQNPKKFQCDNCGQTFGIRKKFYDHKLRHMTNGKFKDCEVCGEMNLTIDGALYHFQLHVDENVQNSTDGVYECYFCKETFTTVEIYKTHASGHLSITYDCFECSQKFANKVALWHHIKIHFEDKIFPCNYCHKVFNEKASLNIHKINHHNNKKQTQKIYECSICPKKFIREVLYKNHLNFHTEECTYECDICSKKFLTNQMLSFHKKRHDNKNKRYFCDLCNMSYLIKSSLLSHMRKIHENWKGECKICKESFKQKFRYQYHMKQHYKNRNFFPCDLCGNLCKTAKGLLAHKFEHANETKEMKVEPYKCNVCLRTFADHGNLSDHMNLHNNVTPYDCNLCKTKFSTKLSLDCHEQSEHKLKPNDSFVPIDQIKCETNQGVHQCYMCDKIFKSQQFLEGHFQKNHDDKMTKHDFHLCSQCNQVFDDAKFLKNHIKLIHKMHMCETCKKCFATSGAYCSHLRIHKNIYYSCELCDKKYKGKRDLLLHNFVHSNKNELAEKLPNVFKCSDCPRYFRSKSAFQDHQNIHTGAKPYECDLCDKKFSNKCDLNKHKKIHDPNAEQFECDVCKRTFKFKNVLQAHIKSHIKNKSKDEGKNKNVRCDKSYKSKNDLLLHKNVHGVDEHDVKEK